MLIEEGDIVPDRDFLTFGVNFPNGIESKYQFGDKNGKKSFEFQDNYSLWAIETFIFCELFR